MCKVWSSSPTRGEGERLFSRSLVLLWLGTLVFSASFQLLTTALPVYAQLIGASAPEIGLLGGLFSLAAMVVRLPTGWWLDRGRKVPILLVGAAIFALSSAGYALVEPVAALLLISPVTVLLGLRLFHGTGMATFATTSQTLFVDVAPASRRGEALGVYTVALNLASGLSPAAGMAIVLGPGYQSLFGASVALALAAILTCSLLPEPASAAVRRPARFFNPAVLVPSFTLLSLMFTFGAVMAFLPLHALARGLENPGLFFATYAAGTLAAQAIAGRASDRFGRLAAAVPGLALAGAGMIAIGLASGWGFLAAGALYGLSMGAAQPALYAWAGDLVPPEQRGSAMATMGLFLEIGIGGGATCAGFLAGSLGLGPSFIAFAFVPLAGLIFGMVYRKRR